MWLAWDERAAQNRMPLDGQGLETKLLGDSGWGSPVSITHPGWDWPSASPCSWGHVPLQGRQRLLIFDLFSLECSAYFEELCGALCAARPRAGVSMHIETTGLPVSQLDHLRVWQEAGT